MCYSTRTLRFLTIMLSMSACWRTTTTLGQDPGLQELSRPADVLLAEVDGDAARSRLQFLLQQVRDCKTRYSGLEFELKQLDAGLPNRLDAGERQSGRSTLVLLNKAIDFSVEEIHRLSPRTDSSWLAPISPMMESTQVVAPIELQVTIRLSNDDVILPAKIALRSAASARSIPFDHGIPLLSGSPRRDSRVAQVQFPADQGDVVVATDVVDTSGVRLAAAGDANEIVAEREHGDDDGELRLLPATGCFARRLSPGIYRLGWQLSDRAVVESYTVELKEPGLHQLEISMKRSGGESGFEVKHDRRPVPANKPRAPSELDSPFSAPASKTPSDDVVTPVKPPNRKI